MVLQTNLGAYPAQGGDNVRMKESRRIALFSLFWHEGVEDLARRLAGLGWKIVVTHNLSGCFSEAGIECQPVADFVGFREEIPIPPTMHPLMELALAGGEEPRIDLLYEIPYALDKGYDVGGLTLISLALKGGRMIATSRDDMESLLSTLEKPGEQSGQTQERLRQNAMLRALNRHLDFARERLELDGVTGRPALELRNGENPYQKPAYLLTSESRDLLSIDRFERISGEAPCFTNLADLDSLVHCVCRLAAAFRKNVGKMPQIAACAKHGNPCGMAVDRDSPGSAIEKALFGNPKAVWGGECVVNFPVDSALASLLLGSPEREKLLGSRPWMLHIIAAPSFSEAAVKILGSALVRKLMANPAILEPFLPVARLTRREIRGGFLVQPQADFLPSLPEDEITSSLLVAWAAAFSSFHGGNEITLAKDGALIGAGGGPSTFEAAVSAVERAKDSGHDPCGSVFAADAFFPFTDAPEVLAKAGCKAGIAPGGGKNDAAVRSLFEKNGIRMCYLPEDARGFCRH